MRSTGPAPAFGAAAGAGFWADAVVLATRATTARTTRIRDRTISTPPGKVLRGRPGARARSRRKADSARPRAALVYADADCSARPFVDGQAEGFAVIWP